MAWAVAKVDAEEIDRTDILSARMKAMQLAIDALAVPADFALVDGNRDHGKTAAVTTPHLCVIKGDSLSMSIAAASILAKVSRDHCMMEMAQVYPEYAFEKHKGYGTKLHYERLRAYGPSAKAFLLDFGIAEKYHGQCNLRFDDITFHKYIYLFCCFIS